MTAPAMWPVRIVKPATYAFGRVEKLLTAGPGRVRQGCPVAGPCGGCGLRHISYEPSAPPRPVCTGRLCAAGQAGRTGAGRAGRTRHGPLPQQGQLPVGTDENGHVVTGFAGRSRRVWPAPTASCNRVDERAGCPRLCAAGGERHHCLQRGRPTRAACAICTCVRAGTAGGFCALW